jgi:hypothetical protein
MKRIIIVLSLALVATKPCPPPPCPTTAVCDEKADWVAVGHVKHLKHNFQGMPLNHDFASFTFVVEKWIKGGDKLPREIPFAVGWCENSEEMRDGKGTFKFWGMNGGPPWRYLHFEQSKP